MMTNIKSNANTRGNEPVRPVSRGFSMANGSGPVHPPAQHAGAHGSTFGPWRAPQNWGLEGVCA